MTIEHAKGFGMLVSLAQKMCQPAASRSHSLPLMDWRAIQVLLQESGAVAIVGWADKQLLLWQLELMPGAQHVCNVTPAL